MKRIFLVCVLVAGLGVGCGEDVLGGTGGSGGTGIIGPLTWDVSNYAVDTDECQSASPTDPLIAFDITIDGSTATLESLDLMVPGTGEPLGGVTMTYDPAAGTVVFTTSFMDSAVKFPDCVVDATDTFTVSLDNPTVSLDQNTTAEVTWVHAEEESAASAMPGACIGNWFVDPPCTSQSTFTLTQQQTQ
ncbi:MAG: hypothetical protein OES69_09530 [Myxococcales bacterium]|nr:hypothetical protein [Myxococcales bacterium]MDH3844166.1 hypothetical protein [Myxococcales bacterium]